MEKPKTHNKLGNKISYTNSCMFKWTWQLEDLVGINIYGWRREVTIWVSYSTERKGISELPPAEKHKPIWEQQLKAEGSATKSSL